MVKPPPRIARLALCLAASCCVAPAAEPALRTVILVRHAERAGGMTLAAGISEAGSCRAGVLARILADAGVTHIYVTEVERTQQTAEPLAKKLALRPEVVPAKDIDGLISRLRGEPPGAVALVVAHGDTLPAIVGRLGGGAVPPVGDTEYDRFYVVTLAGAGPASVLLLRYPGCAR
jgi:broad specificity phosphatase PhoE